VWRAWETAPVVGQGVGVAPALREVAKRFAQRAVLDLLDSHMREFAIDAGTAVEFLAKAVVATDDPASLFEIRKDEPPLAWRELAVLNPKLQDGARRRLLVHEVQEARVDLARRRTISASRAVRDAFRLASINDELLIAAAKGVHRRRNACIHWGDEPVGDVGDAADEFVMLADRLWTALHRSRTELWGWATMVAEVSILGRRDSIELDAQMRIGRSQHELAAVGVVGAARRDTLMGRSPNARCPSCHRRAFVHRQPPGSGPAFLPADSSDGTQVMVLDCLICGLSLWGEQIEMYAVSPGEAAP
jgi:hypothetical protein